jgi:hypothetical protein
VDDLYLSTLKLRENIPSAALDFADLVVLAKPISALDVVPSK